MVEPVKVTHFLLLFLSAAFVIILGAAYAALFALARMKRSRALMPAAYAAYGGLCAAVFALAYAANLFTDDLWMVLIGVMLLGYLLAPHAVLRLSRAMDLHERN